MTVAIGRPSGLPPLGGGMALPVADDLIVIEHADGKDSIDAGLPLALTAQLGPSLAIAGRAGIRFTGGTAGPFRQASLPLGVDGGEASRTVRAALT